MNYLFITTYYWIDIEAFKSILNWDMWTTDRQKERQIPGFIVRCSSGHICTHHVHHSRFQTERHFLSLFLLLMASNMTWSSPHSNYYCCNIHQISIQHQTIVTWTCQHMKPWNCFYHKQVQWHLWGSGGKQSGSLCHLVLWQRSGTNVQCFLIDLLRINCICFFAQ